MADDDWQCPNVTRCELFPALRSEIRLRRYLHVYCYGEFETCARYCYAKAHQKKPPIELLPTGETLSEETD